jgi:hypothetical protein
MNWKGSNNHHHQYQDPETTVEFKKYPLTRVTACVGWAVHGFVLEFANGYRTGRLLSNNQREMGLGDASITSRRIPNNSSNNWVDIDPGDEIISVSGFNLVLRHYLCHSIILHLRSGKCIRFSSRFDGWRGTEFCFEVPVRQQGVLQAVQFDRGRVLGLDFVSTTLHLPIRKELVPTYPTELQWLMRKLLAEEAPGGIPEDVWYTRIFPTLVGAELQEKLEDDFAIRNLVEQLQSTHRNRR